jgi:hypothetical protein
VGPRFEPRRIIDVAAWVSATTVSTAGVEINNRVLASERAIIRTCFSNPLSSRNRTSRTERSDTLSTFRLGRRATSSWIHPAKFRTGVQPAFSPRVRKISRRLFSTSSGLLCISLRGPRITCTTPAQSSSCMHRPKPAQPYQLYDPPRIVAITLHRRRFE